MIYAKLINGYPTFAPNPILHNGLWYGNPPGEVYAAEGYKPVIYADPPEPEPGYNAVENWTETDEAIVQGWTVEMEPVTEDKALTRFSNELTGADDTTLEQAAETLIKNAMEE